jgi:hypothetical protein
MDTKTEELGRTVAGALEGFRTSTNVMVQAASAVGEGIQRIREAATRTSEGASVSLRDLTAVSATAQELLTGINEINKQVLSAAVAMQVAVERASSGGGTTGGLSQAGEQLATVVRLLGEIAGAAKQQVALVRDVSAGLQTAVASGGVATYAMRELISTADTGEGNCEAAARAARDAADLVETLSVHVAEFLPKPSSDDSKLRLYERLRASGFEVTLAIGSGPSVTSQLLDISRTGIAARYDGAASLGTDVTVTLPSGGTVHGRVARRADGIVGIAFPEDDATMVEVDRTLHLLILSGVGAAA